MQYHSPDISSRRPIIDAVLRGFSPILRRLWLLGCLGIAACQDAPRTAPLEAFTYEGKPAIGIAVAQVDLINAARKNDEGAHVEQSLPTTPQQAIAQWSHTRLAAKGAKGTLELTVEDAAVTMYKLPKQKGISTIFTDQPEARYQGHIALTMRLYNGRDPLAVATATLDVAQSLTVPSSATAAERDALLRHMVVAMMQSVDEQAQARLQQYFSPYLR